MAASVPQLDPDLAAAPRTSPLGRGARASLWTLAAIGLIAVLADFLASDLPLAMRLDGRLYLLPNLTEPAELRASDQGSLRASLVPGRGDWMLPTPVPFGPYRVDLSQAQLPGPPSAEHWLGTDETGRDVLARLIHGSRVSLAVGLMAVAFSVLLGVLLGGLAGYLGGAFDAVVSRSVEAVLSFPPLFLALAVVAMLERPGVWVIALVLGLARWPSVARLVRGEALRIRELGYVEAARILGASETRIFLRHVLPGAVAPALVSAAFGVAGAILAESGLSFLGYGVAPPAASWGELLSQAHRYASSPGAWWLAVFPGAAIFATVLAFNSLGDHLRERLDPRAAAEGFGPGSEREPSASRETALDAGSGSG